MKSKHLIIIPALNEATVIKQTLQDIRHVTNKLFGTIDLLVVNDGSRDDTQVIATKYADYVLTHRRNCGLGAALSTGIEFAKRHGYDGALTFDSDGQHDPADIGKALTELQHGADIVIGSRFLGTHSNMPRSRKSILAFGNLVTYLLFGVKTTDSQSGFRALSKHAINKIVLTSNRMEVSSEFFGQIKRHHLKLVEIPIHIRYTEYSMSRGQSNTNAIKVLVRLLYQIIR